MKSGRPLTSRLSHQVLAALGLGLASGVHAQALSSQSDWGGVGLLQTPSARMAEEGELAFSASHVSPYSRYNIALQPFSWLEGSFRYTSVANRRYGPAIAGDQNYKDKSIDVKVRLWKESRWLPDLALGIRDIGGTGLFAGEYLVASKRFGALDASLGLATGYLGNRGDFGNPLGVLDDRFKTRPRETTAAGDFSTSAMFRGRVGIFGGIHYQTPWAPLQLKLEYDGNDYQHEPQNNNQRQRTAVNVGAVYALNRNVDISLGWERGTTMMASIALHNNLKRARGMPKLLDPPPEPVRPRPQSSTAAHASPAPAGGYRDAAEKAHAQRDQALAALAGTDWTDVATRLRNNAGLQVEQIAVRGNELVVSGEQGRYFYPAQGLGRAARVLDNSVDPWIDWFTLVNTRLGMPLAETSINRSAFEQYLAHDRDLQALARATEITAPTRQQRQVLYQAPLDRYRGGFAPGFRQVLGGPDAFILYQLSADYSASYFFSRGTWLSGVVSVNLLNNFDKFRYDAPSNLPRVRTYMRQYLTSSDVTVPNLQLTTARSLGGALYGMAYAGMLESMYGGVGGELLYRPFGERWALGIDLNWVKQRGFEQHLDFRNYQITTGHVSGYFEVGRAQRTVVSVAAGRYLAGDWGATLNVGRVFDNGVTMGAYATKTNVSSEEFGEGSFDKGIYFSVPMDFLLPRSTRGRATVVWSPLTRDGGARLARRYSLYQLTGERDTDLFRDNFDQIDK